MQHNRFPCFPQAFEANCSLESNNIFCVACKLSLCLQFDVNKVTALPVRRTASRVVQKV
jgi:hypothetical protein